MLSIALKILSILGILLLCLLGLVILLVLLVIFFPVSYKLTGKKDVEKMSAGVRVSWLFGLLRVKFDYPEPGRILIKVLPFTVFDSGKVSAGKSKETSDGSGEKADKGNKSGEKGREENNKEENRETENKKEENKKEKDCRAEQEQTAGQEQKPNEDVSQESMSATGTEQTAAQEKPPEAPDSSQEEADNSEPFILKKFKKIKYTICSIYDKIKNIWENISYYMELLREEETKQLFSHAFFRLGKILKSIRPRRIRGQILFGTGAPDTTGYAYGVYGMLSPFLGDRLLVTPDFTRAVLEGDIYIAGHITVFTILWNGLKVLLDKKLRKFIKKMKAGRKK